MRNILNQFAEKKLTAHAVMRAVVAYDQWLVPAVYASQTLGRTTLSKLVSFSKDFQYPPGTLWIFTDLESGTLAGKSARLGPYEGGIRGAELFAKIPASVKEIVINHGSPDRDKLYLRAPGYGNVGVWADVTAFEAKLAGGATPATIDAVKRYDAYFIALMANGSVLTLSQIDGLQNALVLFTGPDSMQELLGKLGAQAATMTTGQTTGERIFGAVAQLGVDGVVINPVGPGVRRVFKLGELAR